MRTRNILKIGMSLARPDVEAPLADHPGGGRWLLVYQAAERYELIRNIDVQGFASAELFASKGVSPPRRRRSASSRAGTPGSPSQRRMPARAS